MSIKIDNKIPELIKQSIPKELMLAVQEGVMAANEIAVRSVNTGLSDGHIRHALGQMRHFYGNEMFSKAIASCGFEATAIKGNTVVTATCGMWTLGRYNTIANDWTKGKRSKSRRELVKKNLYLEQFVQNDFFGHNNLPQMGVVFFVCSHFQTSPSSIETEVDIHIVVTNSKMTAILFDESLNQFLDRYSIHNNTVRDKAVPKLKRNIKRQTGSGDV